MRRREFFVLIGSAVVWPLAAKSQQNDRIRRVGVLLPATTNDAQFQKWLGAFMQELAANGWTLGSNLQVDTEWATNNLADIRRRATDLAAKTPDVILAHGNAAVEALLQATRNVPIVFPLVGDPVASGFVDSLARPGGNATGFSQFEFSLGGKWLELLKEIAPGVTQVAVLRDSVVGSGTAQFAAIQAVAPSLRIEVKPINVRTASDIESGIVAFGGSPNRGLIVTGSASAQLYQTLIVTLSARHKLPAVYYERFFAAAGGLVSYGPSLIDQYRRAAGYVDRILKGEKPAELPVQAPTKYEMVINLKTAKELGLTVPASVLARADEVIE